MGVNPEVVVVKINILEDPPPITKVWQQWWMKNLRFLTNLNFPILMIITAKFSHKKHDHPA